MYDAYHIAETEQIYVQSLPANQHYSEWQQQQQQQQLFYVPLHKHNRFTALLDFVRDYPGEMAPERYNQEGKTNLDLLQQEIVSSSSVKSAPWPRQPPSHHSATTQLTGYQSNQICTSFALTKIKMSSASERSLPLASWPWALPLDPTGDLPPTPIIGSHSALIWPLPLFWGCLQLCKQLNLSKILL